LILEEIQLASWNLTANFLQAKLNQGKLQLDGLGDPSNGFGGISYVKVPLKANRKAHLE
jgi:hypothetical protein